MAGELGKIGGDLVPLAEGAPPVNGGLARPPLLEMGMPVDPYGARIGAPGGEPAALMATLLRRRWLILSVFLAGCLLTMPLIWLLIKPTYVSTATIRIVPFDPCTLPPEQRHQYVYEGPEIIYTFWSKHGPCPADGCGHRTPIFSTPVIATKTISIKTHKVQCHHCKKGFDWDLADPRMAPAEPLIASPEEPAYVCPEPEDDKANCR